MSISAKTRFTILKRDGFACHYCGKRAPAARLNVDHIVPVSKGGTDDPGNLISACWQCNIGKFTSDLFEPDELDTFVLFAETEASAIRFLLELAGMDDAGAERVICAPLNIITREHQ